ncbi:hypothetical protein KY362_02615 [Candidatus Woesearchaeota archaeon]|nr:hypothetical protein [Candidatus Woesearchaeota archaeon]
MSPVKLTKAQLEAKEEIQAIIETPVESRCAPLIILEGLSGVGKDTLYETIREEFDRLRYKKVESFGNKKICIPAKTGHFLTTATPDELEHRLKHVDIRWEGDVHKVRLNGMSPEEILEYLTGQGVEDPRQIAHNSMGIPLLADRMLKEGYSSESDQLSCLLEYLTPQFSSDTIGKILRDPKSVLEGYVRIFPDARLALQFDKEQGEARARAKRQMVEYKERRRQRDIEGILRRREELKIGGYCPGATREGRENQPSHEFIAPESEELYDRLETRGDPYIQILAAVDTDEQFRHLEHMLFSEPLIYRIPGAESPRFYMFGAMLRKVAIILAHPAGHETHTVNCEWHQDDNAEEYARFVIDLESKGVPEDLIPKQGGRLFVEAHDHEHQYINPRKVGWLTETLLQHAGMPYVVDYFVLQETYRYDPEDRRMHRTGQLD